MAYNVNRLGRRERNRNTGRKSLSVISKRFYQALQRTGRSEARRSSGFNTAEATGRSVLLIPARTDQQIDQVMSPSTENRDGDLITGKGESVSPMQTSAALVSFYEPIAVTLRSLLSPADLWLRYGAPCSCRAIPDRENDLNEPPGSRRVADGVLSRRSGVSIEIVPTERCSGLNPSLVS